MPSTNAKTPYCGHRGFTLVELMAAAIISLIVFAALFSAYIFIARNITRVSFGHQQTLQSSRLLHLFANDVGAATHVTAATNWQLGLLFSDGSTVVYAYDPVNLSLQRTSSVAGTPAVTLNGITPLPLSFSTPALSSNVFNYYDQTGTNLLPPPASYPPPNVSVLVLIDIRQIELSFMSSDGVTTTGTMIQTPHVSSRIVLRNKPPLGQ
jgi:prepilin-type N-terminal cleavage/methylation domain-containing protein